MGNIPERYATDRANLAAELKRLRQEHFSSGTAAARALGWSQPKISKIENAAVLPSADDVERLLDLCGASSERRTAVLELVHGLHSTVESNRTILRRGAARKQHRIAEVEAEATDLRYYAAGAIPGLLQTGAYMRQIFTVQLDQAELVRTMNARIERQQALYDTSKHFTFILNENTLRWRFVPDTVLAAQIGHILTLSTLGNVTIGILPPDAKVRDIPLHGFEIFDDRLVTIGLEHATITVTEPRDIAIYTQMFRYLTEAALFDDDAGRVLTSLL
jgi:transcriptional regulator with XRE-family HTH domain